MHSTLEQIIDELNLLKVEVQTKIPSNEPFNVAHNNWSFPGVTRDELVEVVERTITLITDHGTDQQLPNDPLLLDYKRRLVFLRAQTLPQLWGSPALGVSSFLITMQGLQVALENTLPSRTNALEIITQEISAAKSAAQRLRALEMRISDLEPRSSTLDTMVDRIEKAHTAADQLPTDLESMREARASVEMLLNAVSADRKKVGDLSTGAEIDKAILFKQVTEAEGIVERCGAAYAAATSHGLAAAFTERSRALAKSMWVWVFGLVGALGLGSWLGSKQLQNLSEILKTPNSDVMLVVINLLLALLSVGAPIWFSWLATKQVGQRFRLAEDYGFKASISRAYEGYRREAENIDPVFVSRLFASALSRLDEQPLRLVETASHGSPWHELASSDLVRRATEAVPEFASTVTQLAKDTLAALRPAEKSVATTNAPDAKE